MQEPPERSANAGYPDFARKSKKYCDDPSVGFALVCVTFNYRRKVSNEVLVITVPWVDKYVGV